MLYDPSAKGVTLADLMQLEGRGVVTITANADGTHWRRTAIDLNS
jgi:hypothetical protein